MNLYVYDLSGLMFNEPDEKSISILSSKSPWYNKLNQLLCPINFPKVKADEADYFIVPIAMQYGDEYSLPEDLQKFEDTDLSNLCNNLPHWQTYKQKHVFFIVGDAYKTPKLLEESIVFKTSCHKSSKDPCFYYDVVLDVPELQSIENCSNVCAFVGCLDTHITRAKIPVAISKIEGKVHFESTSLFFYLLSEEEKKTMSDKWRNVLLDSQFILVPRGTGLGTIRFFEALAFGRIPVKLSDYTKLPLESVVDYSKFVVNVPEKHLDNIAVAISRFKKDNDLSQASKLAKETWDKYFSQGNLRCFIEASLPKKIFL